MDRMSGGIPLNDLPERHRSSSPSPQPRLEGNDIVASADHHIQPSNASTPAAHDQQDEEISAHDTNHDSRSIVPIISGNRLIAMLTFAGFIVTTFMLWPSVAGQKDSRSQLTLAEWTAMMDFIEFCAVNKNFETNPDCAKISNSTLPAPPGFMDNLSRLVRRRYLELGKPAKRANSGLVLELGELGFYAFILLAFLFLLIIWQTRRYKQELRAAILREKARKGQELNSLERGSNHNGKSSVLNFDSKYSSNRSDGSPLEEQQARRKDIHFESFRNRNNSRFHYDKDRPNFRWWIPKTGICPDVIDADIERYLGPGAKVKSGVGNHDSNTPGYWIAAYRNLTTAMINDLKEDSANLIRSRSDSLHEIEFKATLDAPVLQQLKVELTDAYAAHKGYPALSHGYSRYEPSVYAHPSKAALPAPNQAPNHLYTTTGSSQGALPSIPPSYSSDHGQSNYRSDFTAQLASNHALNLPTTQTSFQSISSSANIGIRPPRGYYLASDGRYYPQSEIPRDN